MRTTLRIDDDLMMELKARAQREKTSLTKLINRVIGRGLSSAAEAEKRTRPYRERTYSMGVPAFSLDKALALAAELEEDEVLRKTTLRK